MSRPSRLIAWLVILLINLALLGTLEWVSGVVLRRVYPKVLKAQLRNKVEHPFEPITGWGTIPNAIIGSSLTRIETDSAGRSVVPDPLPNPRFVLVVTGGSTMFGVGVTNNALTVPSRLQTLLRTEHGLPVNVVNLATRGFVSFQEMAALDLYLADHRVDGGISVGGYNDSTLFLAASGQYFLGPRFPREAVEVARANERGDLIIRNVVPTLRRVSQTANLITCILEGGKVPDPQAEVHNAHPLTEAERRVRVATGHYDMMRAACRARDALFHFYLQPTAVTKQTLSADEQRRIAERISKWTPEEQERMATSPRAFYAAFPGAARDLPWTSLVDVMGSSTNTCYIDHCHYTELGTALLARAIADDLAPRIRAHLAQRAPDSVSDSLLPHRR
jgi:hypothetical protein